MHVFTNICHLCHTGSGGVFEGWEVTFTCMLSGEAPSSTVLDELMFGECTLENKCFKKVVWRGVQ